MLLVEQRFRAIVASNADLRGASPFRSLLDFLILPTRRIDRKIKLVHDGRLGLQMSFGGRPCGRLRPVLPIVPPLFQTGHLGARGSSVSSL